MRVLYLDHTARLSGGEIALLRLLPHLTDVSPTVVLAEDGPLVSRLRAAGIPTEVLAMDERAQALRKDSIFPHARLLMPAVSAVAYTFRIARLLRRRRPDLVHTNSLKAGVYGTIAARIAGVPVVWHVRDRIADDYLPGPAVWLIRLLVRTLPDAVIVNSEETLRTVASSGAVVVYSVVEEFAELPPDGDVAPPAADGFCVGMVGRLAPWKGQDVFLKAFASAFAEGEERAVIVGAAMFGEEAYGASLQRLATELGIADRVEFRGFREDVAAELAAMDVLVHASLSPEPFGQVILEGLAHGVPVVASAGGGPSEILTDGADGLLYPRGDVDGLADRLTVLRNDDALRLRLSGRGRGRAAEFGPGRASERVLAVYRQVLAGRAAS